MAHLLFNVFIVTALDIEVWPRQVYVNDKPEHRSAKKTRRISTHPYKSKETSPIRIMNYSPTTAHNIAIQNQRKTPKDLEADLKNKYDAVIDMKNLEK